MSHRTYAHSRPANRSVRQLFWRTPRFLPIVVLILFLGSLFGLPSAHATQFNPATDWFKNAKYGVFQHIIDDGTPSEYQAFINAIDVNAIANQLAEAGAAYYVLTLGQNSGYYNSPNATYVQYTGRSDHLSTRDLPLDFYNALQPKGIKLMLYLPSGAPGDDPTAANGLGVSSRCGYDWCMTDTFRQRWSAVIQEWSDRYGTKIAGWWFDGAYANSGFNDTYAASFAAAAKHGNAQNIVAFNPGIGVRYYTSHDDYVAGEQTDLNAYPSSRWLNGIQWHTLTYLGSSWKRTDTRFSTQTWTEYVSAVTADEGVVTLDAGPTSNGTISTAQMDQLRAIKTAIRGGPSGTTPTPTSTTPPTSSSNVALNKPASANTVYGTGYEAPKANDGDIYTLYASIANGTRQWWKVDLGAPYRITRLEIVTRQDGDQIQGRADFEVQGSNDSTFASYTVLGSQGSTPIPFGATWIRDISDTDTYRYVRVIKTNLDSFTIAELRVFSNTSATPTATPTAVPTSAPPTAMPTSAPPTATPPTSSSNVALNKPASANTVYGTGYEAPKANDGDIYTLYASIANGTRQWWKVDLGAPYRITRLEIVTRQDGDQIQGRANFEVQGSNDSTFASYTVLGSQGSTPIPFGATWIRDISDTDTYRYVRVIKINLDSFTIAELRVLN